MILALVLAVMSQGALSAKIKLNPWKELFRPNCAGEECLDADYKEHKKKLRQQEREKKRQEKEAARVLMKQQKLEAKQRQAAACRRNTGSGTAHTTAQCR